MSEIESEETFVLAVNDLEKLLLNALDERCPEADFRGADKKVFEFLSQDVVNWLKFHWRLFGEESNVMAAEKIEEVLSTDEFREVINTFVGMWLGRWNWRAKLVLNDKDVPKLKGTPQVTNWVTPEQKRDLIEAITNELIVHGEIAGTTVLAGEILLRAQAQMGEKHDVFALLSVSLRLTRAMASQTGPLIFVKVDKHYYNSV